MGKETIEEEMSRPSSGPGIRAPVGASWCDIFRIYWCWCGAVRVFVNFVGAGAVRSEFLKNIRFWCGAVLVFEIFELLVRCGPRFFSYHNWSFNFNLINL